MSIPCRPTLALLAAAAMLAAACGDADPTETSEPTEVVDDADDAADSDADELATDDEPDPDADESDESDESEDDGLLDELSFDRQSLFIEYQFTHDQPDAPERMTIAQDGDRFATSFTAQGMEVASFFEGDELGASCFDDGSGWMCLEQDLGEQVPDASLGTGLFEDPAIDEAELRDHFLDPYTDEIERREAICGRTDDLAPGEGEVCVDRATGLLLRVETSTDADGDLTIEAVEVREATDDDFTPPADPQPFGG